MSELAPLPSPARRRGQKLESLERIERQIAMLEVQKRLLIAQVSREDRGGMYARYVADELAMVWRRSSRQCQNRIDTALVFADFPAVHALIGERIWLIDHADAAIDELVRSGLDGLQQQQVLELVLSRRVHVTPWQVRQAVRTAVMVLFPEHVAEQAARKEIDRTVSVFDDGPGASLLASGPTHLVAAMMASLDELCRTADSDDPRTLGQRRFDTLQALVCGEIRPSNWQVHVLTALTTLNGEDELPGEVVGHGPIPASQGRELARQGVLRRVVVDDDGMLVAVDVSTHRPDLTPNSTAPAPRDEPKTEEPQPEPVAEQVAEVGELPHRVDD